MGKKYCCYNIVDIFWPEYLALKIWDVQSWDEKKKRMLGKRITVDMVHFIW